MQIERLDGGKTEIADAAIQELRTAFRGSLLCPAMTSSTRRARCGTA